MTEADWLACTDPLPMLEYLRDKTSDRKWRLYLCGGCHHIAHLYFRPESLAAVEVAERFADGEASREELDRAEWNAESPTFGYEFQQQGFSYSSPVKTSVVPRLVEMGLLPQSALSGGEWQVNEVARQRLLAAAELADFCASCSPREEDWGLRRISEVGWPGHWLFDCVFGNPFRPATINPDWLEGIGGTVRRIAQGIYDGGAFEHLPILADALEDAAYDNADILAHCRQPGEHVRGCWVLDLLLGKG